MLNELIQALVQSKNEAADEVLVEALRLGAEPEKMAALNALLRRRTNHGLSAAIALYKDLPQSIQLAILQNIRTFHPALRECGRSEDPDRVLAAMKLIALGRQGKLAYVPSEVLHNTDEELARGAVEALVALARWVATETRRLQKQPATDTRSPEEQAAERAEIYQNLMEQRPDIEQAVARAIDVHRGRHGQELLRAALLLADWPGSKTLAILNTPRHGGQSLMVRRLQQPPDSEHVEAFLLGASHGGLRTHFGLVVSHIREAPVLDALLRRSHWLEDYQLQLCLHQVSRGVWWNEAELERDLSRRDPDDVGKIGRWLAVSGAHDVVQDQRMEKLRLYARNSFNSRLRLLRLACQRPRGSSLTLLQSFLGDSDERLVRLAAREIVRRRPAEMESMLLPLMTSAPDSVRRVIARGIGQEGFENFWQRFDRLDKATRKSAGLAMLKILPDANQRLARRLVSGPLEQRLKAIQIVQELRLVDALAAVLVQLCADPNARIRSKAVALLGETSTVPSEALMDRVLHDTDARVRANAIEVLESRQRQEYVPLLSQRARSADNRERANAIKAMHRMKVATASVQLLNMLRDERAEHRISALWTLRQIGWWQLINEVGKLAKEDPHLRVRRYAMGVLRGVAESLGLKQNRSAG